MELFILGTVAGIVLHRFWVKLVVWHTLRELKRAGIDINDLVDETKNAPVVRTLDLCIEADRDQFLFYDAHSCAFLVQGQSYQEIWHKLKPLAQGRVIQIIGGDQEAFKRFEKTKSDAEVA